MFIIDEEAIQGDDIPSSLEELAAIRRGLDDIRHGRTHTMLPGESLDDFMDRIDILRKQETPS